MWQDEHTQWEKRSLAHKRYVYLWVDGIHFGVRMEEANQCILVVMGATAEGKKELVALTDGFRESTQSWKDLLLDMKRRGLQYDPQLAIGDGALGFWKALPQVGGVQTTLHRVVTDYGLKQFLDGHPSKRSIRARQYIGLQGASW